MSVHYTYYLSGLLLLLASCSKQELTEEPGIRSPYETVTITAGIPMTRMASEAEGSAARFLWERGDLITLATADQQLPYVTTNNGPSAIFYSASTNTDQPEDFLKNVEGKEVYARYPYSNKAPIDMDSLTTPVMSGSPFLYAVETISQAKLNLNFRHAMAYLRFHVKHDPFPSSKKMEIGGRIDADYIGQEESLITLQGKFDYKTQQITPTVSAGEMDIPYSSFMDSVTLFPIIPITSVTELAFELHCRSEEFFFQDRIDKKLPEGGLQAGHVYDIYLDFSKDNATSDRDEVMTVTKQKEYLESVALAFMDMMPSPDFREIAELGQYIRETYVTDYDWDNVETWGRDTFESLREALGTTTKETETVTWDDGSTSTYNYYFTNYKALLLASNFTGQFTAQNGQWTLSTADDLRFIFQDQTGKECMLKLETSGEIKKVYLFNYDDWTDYEITHTDTTFVSNDYYDRTQCTIGVPEKVVVTLTQGGSEVIKASLNVDLGTITDERFDISKNNLTLSFLTELKNGYQFKVSQVAYEANKKASVAFEMSNNRGTLVSAAVAGDLSGIPSCNVDAFSETNFDSGDYNFDEANAKNAFVKLDIIGKVQIQGVIPDVRQYSDCLDTADQVDDNEEEYKSYISQANELIDVNLFYDGNSTKQAAVKLEPFLEDDWGYAYWTAEPVLHFYDGSSYSAFEAFFNDTEFKKVIDTFKKLSNRYADLVGEHIDYNW